MDTKNLDITERIFTVLCQPTPGSPWLCITLHKWVYKKENRDKRHKWKMQYWRMWMTDLYSPKSHLIGHCFVFNSLPINPLKILCNKELALCLPPITASWEQKPVSKICVVSERTKQNRNGLLPSWAQLNHFSYLRPLTKVILRKNVQNSQKPKKLSSY